MAGDKWAKDRMKDIKKELRQEWGNIGWRNLGEVLQSALIDQKILNLVNAQGMDTYKPAKKMIEQLREAI